jgi:hypothetical protein
VARRPREIELTVERPLGPEGGVARLTARFDLSGAEPPTPGELAKTLEDLKGDLDALVGLPLAALPSQRPDRELSELVDAYRPRQRELIDLLRDEGEITSVEHARLAQYLAGGGPPSTSPAASVPIPLLPPSALADRPLAAMPATVDRPTEAVRPVAELLREYEITTLKQAGAVRARRQISFGEYMALKRHFEGRDAGAGAP